MMVGGITFHSTLHLTWYPEYPCAQDNHHHHQQPRQRQELIDEDDIIYTCVLYYTTHDADNKRCG